MFRMVLIVGISIVVGVAIVAILWKVPELQVEHLGDRVTALERAGLRNEYRRTLAQIVGGLGLLVGLYLTWRRISATEKQVLVAEDGQITERFTRAIQQLGHRKLEVRLGGIYALERIARDSPKDHWTIMEILTAYVRENARWQQSHKDESSADPDSEPPNLPADIQAILTVLGRRNLEHERGEPRCLDLRETDLRRADLREAHLESAHFSGAHLGEANFWRAHLEKAMFEAAHLKGAHFWEAHLAEAIFARAHLGRADFVGARLERAIFEEAHLQGALFREAYLKGADFWEAHLQNAVLSHAHLEGAVLTHAQLDGADLSGAYLEDTGLTETQLEVAIVDDKTKLPEALMVRTPEPGSRDDHRGAETEKA